MPFHTLNTVKSNMQVLRCPLRNQTELWLVEISENSPVCRSGKSNLWVIEWVWSNGRKVLTGENWSTGRETSHSAILSTTNLTWSDLGSNTRLRGDRPVTDSCHRVTELHFCHHELVTHNCSATGRSMVACSCYCRICVSVFVFV